MSTSNNPDAEQADDAATRQASSETDSLSITTEIAAYWQSLTDLLQNALELVALEGRLAALTVTRMLVCGIGAATLVVTGWLALVAALAVWLYHRGVALEAVLLGIGFINALTAYGVWLLIKRLSRNLSFAATRRQLTPPPSQARQDGDEQ